MTKVHEVSPTVADMVAASQPIRDLIAGEANMKARGKTYLPKFPQETDEDYAARKASSWLFDGVGKALEDYVSRLFDKPITPVDEGQIAEWCENIDLEGRDLSNFAQDVFRAQVQDGITFIMADAPPRESELTVGQVRQLNIRPYLSHIQLSSVLGWKVSNINNAPVISQFRFMERVSDPDAGEFSDATIGQIRVLSLTESGRVGVRLYRETEKDGWQQFGDEMLTDQTEIMVTPVYSGRTGFLKAKPPLARLANINLAHWRSQSDQSNILHHARAPIKVFIGWSKEDLKQASEGPGYAFITSNPDAKIDVFEHSGAAIEAGRQELKDLEQQMQWVGLQLVMSKAGGATATGDMIDEKKNTSALGMWADNLKDALEIALTWLADLGGISGANTDVSVSKDFVAVHLNNTAIDQMIKMGVPPAYILSEMKRRGELSEDVDVEAVADQMSGERSGLM